jgi:hypothetical protein
VRRGEARVHKHVAVCVDVVGMLRITQANKQTGAQTNTRTETGGGLHRCRWHEKLRRALHGRQTRASVRVTRLEDAAFGCSCRRANAIAELRAWLGTCGMPVLHAAHCMSHAICRMLHAVCCICSLHVARCMPAIAQLSVKRHLQHWPEHRPSPEQEQLQTHRQTRSAITSALESGTGPSLSAYVANGAPERSQSSASSQRKNRRAGLTW